MEDTLDFVRHLVFMLINWIKGIVMVFVPRKLRFKDISSDIIVLTGAGSGIGRLLAIKLAELGATLVIWDVNKAGMDETASAIKKAGGKCLTYICDVSNRHNVYETAARVKAEVGVVTMLINNAGVVNGKRFLQLEDEKMIKLMEINTFAHFWTVKAFLPDMLKRKAGHIVTTASIAGLTGSCSLTDYCASKFANIGFEEALRYELMADGHHNVHSTIVCPWFINTGLFAGAQSDVIPFLEPDFVVNEIVAGILVNQSVIFIPKMLYFLYVLKSFLPVSAMVSLFMMLKGDKAMDTFTGRAGGGVANGQNQAKTKSN